MDIDISVIDEFNEQEACVRALVHWFKYSYKMSSETYKKITKNMSLGSVVLPLRELYNDNTELPLHKLPSCVKSINEQTIANRLYKKYNGTCSYLSSAPSRFYDAGLLQNVTCELGPGYYGRLRSVHYGGMLDDENNFPAVRCYINDNRPVFMYTKTAQPA